MVQRMSAQAEIRDSATVKFCAHEYEHSNEIAPRDYNFSETKQNNASETFLLWVANHI